MIAEEMKCKTDFVSVSYISNYFRFFISQGGIIGEEHLYRVPYASIEDNIAPQCVTCMMTDCKMVKADFSPSGKQVLITCSAPFKHSVVYLIKTSNILER